jgi:hypothetical protein
MGVGCKLCYLAALSPEGKPQYPLNNRLDGPRNSSGSFGEEKRQIEPCMTKLETCTLPAFICQVVPVNKLHAMEVYQGPTSTVRSVTLNSNKYVKYECGLYFCSFFPVKPISSFSLFYRCL